MTSKSLQDPIERLKQLGLQLRKSGNVEWNAAKCQGRRETFRVEFFRGKDFERYFAEHPDLLDEYIAGGNKSVEEKISELGNRFLKNGLVSKAERKFKKPKPGKPRLVKWPKTLLPSSSTKEGWERDLFYCWMYERPMSAFMSVMIVLFPIVVITICLFPLAPYIVKLSVFYISSALLILILGLLSVRAAAWMIVWVLAGYDFWILPNILDEKLSLPETVSPLVSFSKVEGLRGHILLRLMAACGVVGVCLFLLQRNPGSEVMKESAKDYHDAILEFLSIKAPSKQLTGEVEVEEGSSEL